MFLQSEKPTVKYNGSKKIIQSEANQTN